MGREGVGGFDEIIAFEVEMLDDFIRLWDVPALFATGIPEAELLFASFDDDDFIRLWDVPALFAAEIPETELLFASFRNLFGFPSSH